MKIMDLVDVAKFSRSEYRRLFAKSWTVTLRRPPASDESQEKYLSFHTVDAVSEQEAITAAVKEFFKAYENLPESVLKCEPTLKDG